MVHQALSHTQIHMLLLLSLLLLSLPLLLLPNPPVEVGRWCAGHGDAAALILAEIRQRIPATHNACAGADTEAVCCKPLNRKIDAQPA
jgi:hypothetical protein